MLSRYTLSVVALFALTACCREPTDATLVGSWQVEKSSYRMVFHPDHTLSFTYDQGTIDGTWIIAGRILTTTLRHPLRSGARPDGETIAVYREPKICRDQLLFGPSHFTTLERGQQIGEGDQQVAVPVYRRVR